MKIGAVFPQIEIGDDPDIIARFATTAEELGYDHIIAYDHVLGAGTANRPIGPVLTLRRACSTNRLSCMAILAP